MAQHARRVWCQSMVVNMVAHHAALSIQCTRVSIEQENIPAKRLGESRWLREPVFDIVVGNEGLGSYGVDKWFVYLRN